METKNPYSKTNVNVAQGPRTGNSGATGRAAGKRGLFQDAKAERAPIADMIQNAYALRQHEYEDFEYTNGGSIEDNVRARFKSKK